MSDTNGTADWLTDAAGKLAAMPPEEREDYLRRLRNLAVLAAPEKNVEPEPPIRTMGQYLNEPITLPPMLVQPFQIARGATTALIARAGKGKTTMTLNRAIRWSVGRPMFDALPEVMAPVKPLRILIIENEGAPGFFQEKLKLMRDSQKFTEEELEQADENILIWGEGGYPRIKIYRDDHQRGDDFELVRRGIEQHEPDLVIMEPFRSLWDGEENSASEMTEVTDRIAELASGYGIGVLLTHHERKSGVGDSGEEMSAGRGSTVLEAEAAVMERYKPVKEEISELSWVKSRFGQPAPPVRMKFVWDRWGYDYVSPQAGEREFLQLLMNNPEGALSVREIAEELEEDIKQIRKVANAVAEENENIKVYPSVSSAEGSTGKRYRYVVNDTNAGGLDF